MPQSTDNVDSSQLFYGTGAATSAPLSEADMALLNKAKDLEVRDGDEFVDIDLGDNTEDDGEGIDTADTPDGKNEGDTPATLDAQVATANTELEEIGEDLTKKGVDVNPLVESLANTGTLTDEQFAALDKAGYPKAAVQAILKGYQALGQAASQAVVDAVGGVDKFNALSDFSVTNEPDALETFNEAFERGDLRAAKVILKGIERSYKSQYGTTNRTIQGKPAGSKVAVAGYASQEEMVKAINDPRYGRDSSYTREVEKKVHASNW